MSEIDIQIFDGVYEPAEDSWLMAKNLPRIQGEVLEIGCGSGIICLHLAKRGSVVTAVDINPKAVDATRINAKRNKLSIEVLEGDLFSCLENRRFDVIVCNPPYLPPADEYNDSNLSLAVEGGPTGSEFTQRLLKEASLFLKEGGSIYTILSSRMKKFETTWKMEQVKEEKYFFERLSLVRFFA